MPDRIIRDELLESERWLALKDNADRLAFIALLLKADALGNFEASQHRLFRIWRDFGIATPALVTKTLTELADHDLIRLYDVDDKRYLHIPRFRQELRYVRRTFPPSPWTTSHEKQKLEANSRRDNDADTALTRRAHPRSEEKGSYIKRSEVGKLSTDENSARATAIAEEQRARAQKPSA